MEDNPWYTHYIAIDHELKELLTCIAKWVYKSFKLPVIIVNVMKDQHTRFHRECVWNFMVLYVYKTSWRMNQV